MEDAHEGRGQDSIARGQRCGERAGEGARGRRGRRGRRGEAEQKQGRSRAEQRRRRAGERKVVKEADDGLITVSGWRVSIGPGASTLLGPVTRSGSRTRRLRRPLVCFARSRFS